MRKSLFVSDTLLKNSSRHAKDHVAVTWLLLDIESGGITAYMSLIADAVRLSDAEPVIFFDALRVNIRDEGHIKEAKISTIITIT